MCTSTSRLLAVAVLLFGMSACKFGDPLEDFVLMLDLSDVPVQIPPGAGTITLTPNGSSGSNGEVGGMDVSNVNNLYSIKISPDDFTFRGTVGAGKTSRAAATGTVNFFVFISGIPVPGFPIVLTIENDVVTAVSPTELRFGDGGNAQFNRAAVETALSSLPAGQRPQLNPGWENLSVNQAVALINTALAQGSFPFSLIATTTGDVSGTLTLKQFKVDAQVTQEQE